MEPRALPPPSTRIAGPTLPAPPSIAGVITPLAPLPATHGSTSAAAPYSRAGAAVLPRPHLTACGGATAFVSVPSKTRATKKIGVAQPSRAHVRSPAAESTPASAGAAASDGAMDDAQKLLEELPARMDAASFWIPQIGMTFSSFDEAWDFWVTYGGRMGFDVRKCYTNTSDLDGLVTSSRFVCLNQGSQAENKKFSVGKRIRAQRRTGCRVRMGITLERENGTYKVHYLFVEHNHILQTAQTSHLMPLQRDISKHQAIDIEVVDDSGITPKAAHEFLGRYVGGSANLRYIHRDHKNYLRTKRQREMLYGEAGSLLKYFQDKVVENPSFQHAIQMDCEEKIANIFWAEAKMIVDYAHFDDVVTFDTTFGTNKEYRPFGMFVGFNQFRETMAFGAALMYDETDQMVSCSCRLFERIGILCRHALKGLDLVNIKLLPERYILKRWTRDARSGIIQDMHGRDIVKNPKLDATLRYKTLCKRFVPLASRAADFEDCCLLVEEALHSVGKQVEEKIKGTPNFDAEKSSVQETFNLPEQYAHVAGLKKKEKQNGGSSKRKKNWTDKFSKKKKKKEKRRK